mgnify:FL=1
MKNTIIFFSFFLFFSCASNFNEQIIKVSELEFNLISLENSFHSVDQQKVDDAIKAYQHNMSQIKKYYYADTVEKEFVQLMNSYKAIKKGGKGLSKKVENINSNIITMKQQLSYLKADLENQLLVKDSALFYISNEEHNLNLLNENITDYVLECDVILSLDDSLAIKVKALINSYKE